jgi:sarcosine oxidase
LTTGYVDIGSELVDVSLESCRLYDLRHELVDGRELGRRHPGYRVPPDLPALVQPDGGFLLAEDCVVEHVVQAQALGADIRGREAVRAWESVEGGVRVETGRASYTADHLVVAAGAWAAPVGRLDPELAVAERNALAWFQPLAPELFGLDCFPCFGLTVEEGIFYGFPQFGVPGLKVGRLHHRHERIDPTASTASRTRPTRRSSAPSSSATSLMPRDRRWRSRRASSRTARTNTS